MWVFSIGVCHSYHQPFVTGIQFILAWLIAWEYSIAFSLHKSFSVMFVCDNLLFIQIKHAGVRWLFHLEIVWSCHCRPPPPKSVGCGRQISLVNLVTIAWAWHSRVWILAGIRDYCCCQCVQSNFGARPVYFSVGIGFLVGGSMDGGVKLTALALSDAVMCLCGWGRDGLFWWDTFF